MDPLGTQFNISEFDLAYPDGVENHYWHISRNFLLANLIRKAGLRDLPILEIGCGKGLVVAAMRTHKLSCWGVELADVSAVKSAAPYVKSNTDATALDAVFRNQIKVLMILDVLEHIEDPVKFLQHLLPFFPQATQLIVSVPARQEIWSNYDEFYRHYRRYNPEQVKETIRQLNFTIQSSAYIFHILYGLAKLRLLFTHDRPVKINAPRGLNKSIHRIMAWLLIVESLVLPGKLPGSSIFCLASKKI